METLSKDVLVLLAMELNYVDILKFCQSSKRINRYVCENSDFWRNWLYKEYPAAGELKVFTEEDNSASGFAKPVYVRPELVEFLRHTNLGFISGTRVPINLILKPALEKGILNRNILTNLFANYFLKHQFMDNGKKKFRVGDNMSKYLDKYLKEIEDKERGSPNAFNRNNFIFNKTPTIIAKLIIPDSELTVSQREEFKKTPLFNIQKAIQRK